MSTLCKLVQGRLVSNRHELYQKGHLRLAFVVLVRFLAPSQVPSLIHRPLAVVPLILPWRPSRE